MGLFLAKINLHGSFANSCFDEEAMVVMEEVVVLGPRQRFSDMTTLAATCGNVLF